MYCPSLHNKRRGLLLDDLRGLHTYLQPIGLGTSRVERSKSGEGGAAGAGSWGGDGDGPDSAELVVSVLLLSCILPSPYSCSRLETDLNAGTCHLLELMTFKSTGTRLHQQVAYISCCSCCCFCCCCCYGRRRRFCCLQRLLFTTAPDGRGLPPPSSDELKDNQCM